jgi:hypothetical protein
MVLVLVVGALGWGGYRVFAPDEPERGPSIVVVAAASATAKQLNVIGPRIQGAAGVVDVEYLSIHTEFQDQVWDDTEFYLENFGTPFPSWYSVTVKDDAAHEALENGGFAEGLLDLPGVAKVYFGCPDLAACAYRELLPSDSPTRAVPGSTPI